MATSSVKTVDEVILSLPRKEQLIVKRLRALALECLPTATEKVSFGVPFYNHHRAICFIWPPSINPMKPTKKRPVETRTGLGFWYGNKMGNEDGALQIEGRKQIYCLYFESVKEINDDQIRALLFEAGMIDETFRTKSQSSKAQKSKFQKI